MEYILKSTIFFLKCLKKSWIIKNQENKKKNVLGYITVLFCF